MDGRIRCMEWTNGRQQARRAGGGGVEEEPHQCSIASHPVELVVGRDMVGSLI